jgi:hypothetical protein
MAENKLKRTQRVFELDVTAPMTQSQAIGVVAGHGTADHVLGPQEGPMLVPLLAHNSVGSPAG